MNGCTTDSSGVHFSLIANESLYIFKRAADGVVVANSANATSGAAECTFSTTTKINITSAAPASNVHKVLIDFYGGVFAQATPVAGVVPASGPMILVDLGTGTGNTVKIRGTANADLFTFGTVGANSLGSFTVGTTTTTLPTARVLPDLQVKTAGLNDLVVSMGPGNDTVTGQGGPIIGGAALVAGVQSASALAGTVNMAVYGGNDNDTITSGAAGTGVNTLYGNAGNDLFVQQIAKAHDVISGSDAVVVGEIDTLDYSVRTGNLSITLGDEAAAGASVGTINCATKAATTDNDNFTVNDGTHPAKTFEYRKSANVLATGSITAVIAGLADNDSFVLNDGTNAAVTFHYTVSANAATYGAANPTFPADSIIDVFTAVTDNDVAVATFTAINAYATTTLHITATDPLATAVVALTNSDALGAATVNQAITKSGPFTVTGMSGGSHFTAVALRTVIDITATSTADTVCTATAASVMGAGLNLTAVQAVSTDTNITLSITPAGLKPAGAAITKNTGAVTFTVVDFSAGSAAVGSNDGESGELDSINNDIENVIGGAGDDIIDASRSTTGGHVLQGLGGNDTLTGSTYNAAQTAGLPAHDFLYGGAGNDTLIGLAGNDSLFGGDGDDTVQGGAGNDALNGAGVNCVAGTGVVTCVPGTGAAPGGVNILDFSDRVAAVSANLTTLTSGLTAGGEVDVLTAGTFQNLRGGSAADTLTGDSQNNIIWGGGGNDIIRGSTGNDALYGEAGNDNIDGEGGDDFISGGIGTNTLQGNIGNDLIDDTIGTAGSVDCGPGDADVGMQSATGTIMNCE